MKLIQHGNTLCVSEVEELATANSRFFRATVLAALPGQVSLIEIDLSATTFVDCGGLGALIALRKGALQGPAGTTIRLLNPPPQARRLFQLTRADQLFSIDGAGSPIPGPNPARCQPRPPNQRTSYESG